MKRLFTAMTAAVLMAALVATAASASSKFLTFGTGSITESPTGTFTIVNTAGQYGGVYINSRSNSSKLIGTVGFSFTSMGDVAGGAPRFSIPIDDGLGTSNLYAFLDAANCGGASGGTTVVSTSLANCPVFLNNGHRSATGQRSSQPTRRIGSALAASRSSSLTSRAPTSSRISCFDSHAVDA